MKKYIKFFLLLILLPLVANAKNEYTIEEVYMNANLDVLGSVHVQEVVIINGEIDSFEKIVTYVNEEYPDEWEEGKINYEGSSFYNGRGVSKPQVGFLDIKKSSIGWDLMNSFLISHIDEKSDKTKKTDSYYEVTENELSNIVNVHLNHKEGYAAIFFDYYVDQIVVMHEDVGEIYWQLIPKNYGAVNKLNIQVILPGDSAKDTFKFWAHGTTNGTIAPLTVSKDKEGNELYRGIYLELNDYQGKAPIDVRLLFEKDIFSMTKDLLNNSKMKSYDAIVKLEETRSKTSNVSRGMKNAAFTISIILSVIYLVCLIPLSMYVYKTFGKKKSNNEIIDYTINIKDRPYIAEYLLTGKITQKSFIGEVIKLIRTGHLSIKKGKIKVLKDSKNKLDSLTMKVISDKEKYAEWLDEVNKVVSKEGFKRNISMSRQLGIIYFILGLIISVFHIIFKVDNYIIVFTVVLFSLVFLLYTLSINDNTEKGINKLRKWQALPGYIKSLYLNDPEDLPSKDEIEEYIDFCEVLNNKDDIEKALIKLYNETPEYLEYIDTIKESIK